VEITNRKKAAQSLKASLKYYIAKKEHEKKKARDDLIANGLYDSATQRHLDEYEDYVPTKQELQDLKENMMY
jgi:hypothetical protein